MKTDHGRTDHEIAENIQQLISSRDSSNDSYVSMSSDVVGGVRYITFTAMSNATSRESYTFLTMLSDMLGLDDRKETWANPHFKMDFEAIKPFLMDAINKEPKLPIVLSGHGVAGAIAVIAGYHLTMTHYNLQRVVTFGAPPALNSYKTKDGIMWPLQQITHQYVLPGDTMTKMFRWTKYRDSAEWNKKTKTFTRRIIAEGVGTGLFIRTADLDENGKLDIVTGYFT